MRPCALVCLIAALCAPTGARAATIRLGPAGDLQAALNAARPGDTIVLRAGAVYAGPFTLPRKSGSGWITVRGSGPRPPPGRRLTPTAAGELPKLISPGNGQPALQTAPGAHHFRLVGLEFEPRDAAALVYDLVRLGDGSGAQSALAEVPHHLVLDRVYIHGTAAGELKRGLALNSASTWVLNSTIADCKGKGYDTQAIAGWNGPGPFVIENDLLEGAGENLMFGGADPSIAGLVPSGITIRRNVLRVHGDNVASGNQTLARYFPGARFRRNVIAGADRNVYPPDNFYPPTLESVGFANRAGGDYRLAGSSRYRRAAADGKDVGVDFRELINHRRT